MINRYYPYQNWILTIIFGPVLWMLFEIIINGQNARSMFEGIFAFIALGIFYSSPSLVISVLVFKLLIKVNSTLIIIKFILICLGVIGIVLTFIIIGGTLVLKLTLSYSISLIISSLIIRLEIKDNLLVKNDK
jgi:hypothetical protein